MCETSVRTQLANMMGEYKVDILGISESRLTGSGRSRMRNGVELLHSGFKQGSRRESGVALMLLPLAARSLIDFNPVNERIVTARFQGKH